MPTKKKRVQIIPDNLPAITTPEETCPSLFTGTTPGQEGPREVWSGGPETSGRGQHEPHSQGGEIVTRYSGRHSQAGT